MSKTCRIGEVWKNANDSSWELSHGLCTHCRSATASIFLEYVYNTTVIEHTDRRLLDILCLIKSIHHLYYLLGRYIICDLAFSNSFMVANYSKWVPN